MGMLGGADWGVIAVYFAILGVVVWVAARQQETSTDYFLAGRNVGFFAIGASIFASNIGSEHIVGLAGQGAATGLAMAHYELHAWIVVLLAWIFVPFYYQSEVFTMPEFLEKRFGPRPRWILSLVSLATYVFTKVSVTVYAGALVFKTLLPDTFGSPDNAFWVGAFATVVLTGVYTVLGGMRAVLYTDSAQAVVLLIGSAAITYFGLERLGGWGELQEFTATNVAQFALWRPLSDPDFPWLGILIASPIVGIWYWCTDQYIVQRTLAAKDLRTARRGALWGAFLKVWPVLIFLIPGLIGAALNHRGLLALPVDAAGATSGDQVFPTMVAALLPAGLRGLVVAGMLAALMSSLSSLFNSTAALFTVDVYEKLRPGASERQLVVIGRIATVVVVVLGLLWIPVMPLVSKGGLYQYLQSVQGYLAPPITAVFLLGLFNSRINNRGAVWGLGLGFVLGMAKLLVQSLFGAGKREEPAWLAAIGDFNFLYFSGVLFLISVIVVVVASYTSPPPDRERIRGLTFASIDRKAVRASWDQRDVVATAIVLGLVATVYLYFSFWAADSQRVDSPSSIAHTHHELMQTSTILLTSEAGDRLAVQPNVPFRDGVADGTRIVVSPDIRKQTIVGIGSSFTESSAFVLAHLEKTKRRSVMEQIYGETGANFSLARTVIGATDFSVEGKYSYADVPGDEALKHFSIAVDEDGFAAAKYPGVKDEAFDLLPMIKEALAIKRAQADDALRIVASAWTAPPWMKDIEDWYRPGTAENNWQGTGGSLKPRFARTYADYLVRYLDAYQAEGVQIWGLTPVNEPHGNSGFWESMHFTPQSQNAFIKQHLGPALEESGHGDIELLIYDQNRDDLESWTDVIFGDPEAAEFVDGAAVHWYSSTYKVHEDVFERVHQKFPGFSIVHTEATIDNLGVDAPAGVLDPERFKESDWFDNDAFWWNDNATDWAYTATWAPRYEDHPIYTPVHRYARNIIVSLDHWAEGWIDWNVVLDQRGGPNHVGNYCGAPIMIDVESGYVYYTPIFYVLAQFSRTIRPGDRAVQTSKRVDGLEDDALHASATINGNDLVSVQLLNTTKHPIRYSLQIGGQFAELTIAANSVQTVRVQL